MSRKKGFLREGERMGYQKGGEGEVEEIIYVPTEIIIIINTFIAR